jgi:hypothetical protein
MIADTNTDRRPKSRPDGGIVQEAMIANAKALVQPPEMHGIFGRAADCRRVR